MFIQAYKAAFKTIARKPFMLWGLSLLASIICVVATFTVGILGFLGTAFGYVVSVGMAKVYLDGLEGKEVNSDQLFSGFTKRVFRVAGGMAWRQLWIIIWTIATICVPFLVFLLFNIIGASFPFIGFVFTIIGLVLALIAVIPAYIYFVTKTYSYAFVPYILATKPDVTATQALRLSMEMTNGKKLHMWLADLVYSAATTIVTMILTGLSLIPFIGFIFGIVLVAWIIILVAFGPLFTGLYTAEFYRLKPMPKAPKAPKYNPYNAPYNPNGGYNGYNGQPQNFAPNHGYAPAQNFNPQNAPAQQGYAPQQNFNNQAAPAQNYAPAQNFNPQAAPAQQQNYTPNQGYNPMNQ